MPEIEEVLPKYLQIAEYIRDQIECGEFPPGSEVPSERELAAAWRVARPTAAKALQALRQQGLVRSRRGSDTYVIGRRSAARARERYEPARRYGSTHAEDETVTVLDTAVVAGPGHVNDALGLPESSAVIVRKRLVVGASDVAELSTSWFPGDVARVAGRLLVRKRLSGGTARYLEEATGRQAVSVHSGMA